MAPHKSVDQELAGRRRYRLAAYTTAANIVSKSLSLVVLYVSVPLTIHYLGTERFGIWMTLASLIGFLGFLDFGIGSSLLNQVAYSAAKEPRERLRRLITHGLLLLTGLGIVLMAFLLCAARFSRLEGLFNVSNNVDPNELRTAAYTLAILIGLSLPIVGLQRVLWGLQRAFVYHFLVAAGSLA
jgi:O-antigen/teichoic acid export membrane protein